MTTHDPPPQGGPAHCWWAHTPPPKTSRCSRSLTQLVVALEDARLGEAREAFLDGTGARLADTLDVVEVVDRGPHDLLQVAEAVDDLLDDLVRKTRDLREQAIA